MKTEDVIDIFRESGALLTGHFILTSGRHSAVFLQKARVFMHADKTEKLCRALSEKILAANLGKIDYLVGPAVGGIIPVYETSRHLQVPAIWVEREAGVFQLRRFDIEPQARIVIVEDIVTSGLSIRETVACMRNLNAKILAAACLVDRSGGQADTDCPLISLAEYVIPSYDANHLPPELAEIPAIKPGSRHLNQKNKD